MQAKILAEGSQNPMLDLDFGIYPYVTNSNTGLGGIVTGFAVSRRNTKQVIAIKPTQSRSTTVHVHESSALLKEARDHVEYIETFVQAKMK
ncbi:hypothetical protein ACHAO4_008478 [Trichoderma viride]